MFSWARQLGFIIRLGTGSDENIIYGKFARTIKAFCSRSLQFFLTTTKTRTRTRNVNYLRDSTLMKWNTTAQSSAF